ncbi:Vacuolar protein-sorting-associated protein 36 [Rhodotorula kratochvilovae]
MDRFLSLDVTLQTLSAQLYPDERILTFADGVGLYDGKDKSPRHTDGRAVLTTHRALFISSSRPHSNSAYLPLALVRQTEYWAGFLKSSPKITLLLSDAPPCSSSSSRADTATKERERDADADARALTALAGARNWVCRVCGMHNVPSAALGLKCSLCGVTRDPLPSSSSSPPPPPPPRAAPSPAPPALDPKETGARLACPVCTFLNHHSMTRCEVCDSALFAPSSSSSTSLPSSGAPSRAATPGPRTDPASAAPPPGGSGAAFVRLSFRRGGEKGWYAALKEALAARAWDVAASPPPGGRGKGKEAAGADAQGGSGGAGIDAILRGIDLEARDREDSLDDALKDLESLMAKAKEMIVLAQSINAQLSSAPAAGAAGGEAARAASLASTSLHSLGLLPGGAAVTPDLVADDRAYHAELARELAGVLHKGGVMDRAGGVIALDEVWCLWNRARGVALVSPKVLRLAAPYLSTLPRSASSSGAPISLRTFPSGLTILHTPRFALPAVRARVLDLLDTRQALAASLLSASASVEGVSVGLAKELLGLLELGDPGAAGGGGGAGAVVRDEQGEGTRWYRDWISDAVWDGQVFE